MVIAEVAYILYEYKTSWNEKVQKTKEREDAIEIPTLADGSNEEDSSSEDS